MEIYTLEKKHEGLYEEFRRICIINKQNMTAQMVCFIRNRYKDSGLKTAIVGASGGVDSSLTAMLATLALGPENVLLVKLPYRGLTSDESSQYVDLLARACAITRDNVFEIPINVATDASIVQLRDAGFDLTPLEVGNAMARERMKMLFAIAKIRSGMVLDTCNLTEILLGYLTKFGDGASDLNPVGNLFKTWVWILADYVGVPDEIVKRTPTAELSAGQSDEGDLGLSYQVADMILWLRYGKKIPCLEEQLTGKYGFPPQIVDVIERRVRTNRHKSSPTPVCEIKI